MLLEKNELQMMPHAVSVSYGNMVMPTLREMNGEARAHDTLFAERENIQSTPAELLSSLEDILVASESGNEFDYLGFCTRCVKLLDTISRHFGHSPDKPFIKVVHELLWQASRSKSVLSCIGKIIETSLSTQTGEHDEENDESVPWLPDGVSIPHDIASDALREVVSEFKEQVTRASRSAGIETLSLGGAYVFWFPQGSLAEAYEFIRPLYRIMPWPPNVTTKDEILNHSGDCLDMTEYNALDRTPSLKLFCLV